MNIDSQKIIDELRKQIDNLNYNLTLSTILLEQKNEEIDELNALIEDGDSKDDNNGNT